MNESDLEQNKDESMIGGPGKRVRKGVKRTRPESADRYGTHRTHESNERTRGDSPIFDYGIWFPYPGVKRILVKVGEI